MSYQPPGPYPVFPGTTAMPPKPPIPQTVQRAFVLMLVGAGLEIVNTILSLLFAHQVQEKIQQAINDGTTASTTSFNGASTAVGALIGIGLWVWMAFANRSGHNWARITGTVFFGISCLAILIDIVGFAVIGKWLGGGVVAILAVEALVSWLVGLVTVILLWNRKSGDFFQPRMPVYPMGGPGYGYGYPGQMPGAPTNWVQPQQPQQQPGNPWETPPNA